MNIFFHIVNVHVLLSGHQAGKCSIDNYEHRLERPPMSQDKHKCHWVYRCQMYLTVYLNGRKRMYEILMDLSIS